MNPLISGTDRDLLTQHHVQVEVENSANPASPLVGVIVFDNRRFKVNILNQSRAGEALSLTEEKMIATAEKVAVMLLKKELLQQPQPQAQPLDLKINRQGMTLQSDHAHPIAHTDAADINKDTQQDYDALANYLTTQIQPLEEEDEQEEVGLDLTVHEQPQGVPPNYIEVPQRLMELLRNGSNPFLDSSFNLSEETVQRFALAISPSSLHDAEKETKVFVDPAILSIIIERLKQEAEEANKMRLQQAQILLVEEEKKAETTKTAETQHRLNRESSAIVPIPPSISSQPTLKPRTTTALTGFQQAIMRAMSGNGCLDHATRKALSANDKPFAWKTATPVKEEKPEDQVTTANASSSPTVQQKTEDEVIDLTQQPKFRSVSQCNSSLLSSLNNNMQNSSRLLDDIQKRHLQARNQPPFDRPFRPFQVTRSPQPKVVTQPKASPTPIASAPSKEQLPPQNLERIHPNLNSIQPDNPEAAYRDHAKPLMHQLSSKQPSSKRSTSFPFVGSIFGFGKTQSNS